jgi:hypothetical protein
VVVTSTAVFVSHLLPAQCDVYNPLLARSAHYPR